MNLVKCAVATFLMAVCAACSGESEYTGVWKATSVDMSFAEGKIPPENMDAARAEILGQHGPAFDLNSDGSARVFGGGVKCSGTWFLKENVLHVECPNDNGYLMLEIAENKLITLPDRTFTLERQ